MSNIDNCITKVNKYIAVRKAKMENIKSSTTAMNDEKKPLTYAKYTTLYDQVELRKTETTNILSKILLLQASVDKAREQCKEEDDVNHSYIVALNHNRERFGLTGKVKQRIFENHELAENILENDLLGSTILLDQTPYVDRPHPFTRGGFPKKRKSKKTKKRKRQKK